MTLSMASRSMLISGLAAALLGGCLYPEYTEKELAAQAGGAAGKAGESTRGGSNAGVGGTRNVSGGVTGVSTTATNLGGAVGNESGSGGLDVAGTDAGGTGGIDDAAGGIGPISADAGGAVGVDSGSGGIGDTSTDSGGVAGVTAGGNEGFGGIGGTATSGGGAGSGAAVCGNGVVDRGETCDDKNTADNDGCSADCKSDETCGNNIVDAVKGEACDDGKLNGTPGKCPIDCRSDGICGNGFWDRLTEQCDYCSDYFANVNASAAGIAGAGGRSGGSAGSGGVSGLNTGIAGAAGTAISSKPCPITESASCNSDCTLAKCGDNRVNRAAGEECDASTGADISTCNGNAAPPAVACHKTACGDGYINTKVETCDAPGAVDTSACNGKAAPPGIACHAPACGDGYVNPALETCDDGTGMDSAACNGKSGPIGTACNATKCGDGYFNHVVEGCDDGAGMDSASCNGNSAGALSCQMSRCGDGYVNKAANEECDPGPNLSIAGCSDRCKIAPGWDCHADTVTGFSRCTSICADGIVVAAEVCDDFNASSCGTCNASCSATQGPSAAVGSITVAKPYMSGGQQNYVNGDTLVVNDGVRSKIFEFTLGSGVPSTPGNVVIVLPEIDTARQVAQRIANAINSVGPGLAVTAVVNSSLVNLVNDNAGGGSRNAAILVSGKMASTAAVTVQGMSGGRGYDCAADSGCTGNADCASAICCLVAGTPPNCTTANLYKCLAPTCTDAKQNGTETAVDCGGGSCPGCPNGQTCVQTSDCASSNCSLEGKCAAAGG